MSKKDKKIILVAQCLINPYCRVHVLGQNFPLSHELMDYLMKLRVGIIQYPCPETTAMGLQRNPQGRQQYDNIFFRSHCKELLQTPLRNSPTCGINWGKHKVNKYNTESPMPVDTPDPDEPVLMGIMAEILSEKFHALNMDVPFLELPVQQPADSEERARFWLDLKQQVEPNNPEYTSSS